LLAENLLLRHVRRSGPREAIIVQAVADGFRDRAKVVLVLQYGTVVAVIGIRADQQHAAARSTDVNGAESAVNGLVVASLREMADADDGTLVLLREPSEF